MGFAQRNPETTTTLAVEVVDTPRFKHFNPAEHKIETKIATVKSGSHCKYNINYHIIWIPKYGKCLLTGKVKQVLQTIIKGQCEELQADCLALEIMPDHLHLFVGAKPTHKPRDIVNKIKGNTSRQLRLAFQNIHYPYPHKRYPNLWARGYYCGSAGHVSQEQVKRYIEEQEGKPVFEYSVYGAPKDSQAKIGDFSC